MRTLVDRIRTRLLPMGLYEGLLDEAANELEKQSRKIALLKSILAENGISIHETMEGVYWTKLENE